VELASGKHLKPDDIPAGYVVAAAFDSNRHLLLVISVEEGLPGAAEVSAYSISADKIILIGRRGFEPRMTVRRYPVTNQLTTTLRKVPGCCSMMVSSLCQLLRAR
jgi:hypothetical protein